MPVVNAWRDLYFKTDIKRRRWNAKETLELSLVAWRYRSAKYLDHLADIKSQKEE